MNNCHPNIPFKFLSKKEAKEKFLVSISDKKFMKKLKKLKCGDKMRTFRENNKVFILKDSLHFGAGFSCCFERATVHLLPEMVRNIGYPAGIIAHDVLHITIYWLTLNPEIAEIIDEPFMRKGILRGYLNPMSEHNYNWGNGLSNCIDIEHEEEKNETQGST